MKTTLVLLASFVVCALSLNQGIRKGRRWPDATFVYDFKQEWVYQETGLAVHNAIHQIESNTCIRFKRRSKEFKYAKINTEKPGNEAHSSCHVRSFGLGHSVLTWVFLGWCKNDVESTTHELLHALGFNHEQKRKDRDDYIKVHWDKIESSWRAQYKKDKRERSSDLTPYDYNSIMHYYFDNKMEPLDKDAHVGRLGRMSDLDVMGLNKFYCNGEGNQKYVTPEPTCPVALNGGVCSTDASCKCSGGFIKIRAQQTAPVLNGVKVATSWTANSIFGGNTYCTEKTEKFYVSCVKQNGEGMSRTEGNRLTFEDARDHCNSRGGRLPTADEVENGAVGGQGMSFDFNREVWTTSDCDSEGGCFTCALTPKCDGCRSKSTCSCPWPTHKVTKTGIKRTRFLGITWKKKEVECYHCQGEDELVADAEEDEDIGTEFFGCYTAKPFNEQEDQVETTQEASTWDKATERLDSLRFVALKNGSFSFFTQTPARADPRENACKEECSDAPGRFCGSQDSFAVYLLIPGINVPEEGKACVNDDECPLQYCKAGFCSHYAEEEVYAYEPDTNCGGTPLVANLPGGARRSTWVSHNDGIECPWICDANPECAGYDWDEESTCTFVSTLNMIPSTTASCFTKPTQKPPVLINTYKTKTKSSFKEVSCSFLGSDCCERTDTYCNFETYRYADGSLYDTYTGDDDCYNETVSMRNSLCEGETVYVQTDTFQALGRQVAEPDTRILTAMHLGFGFASVPVDPGDEVEDEPNDDPEDPNFNTDVSPAYTYGSAPLVATAVAALVLVLLRPL